MPFAKTIKKIIADINANTPINPHENHKRKNNTINNGAIVIKNFFIPYSPFI